MASFEIPSVSLLSKTSTETIDSSSNTVFIFTSPFLPALTAVYSPGVKDSFLLPELQDTNPSNMIIDNMLLNNLFTFFFTKYSP